MAAPSPDDIRRSRTAAAILVALSGSSLLGSGLASDERFEALWLVLGVPVLVVGALTLAYARIRPRMHRQITAILRRTGTGSPRRARR